MKFFAVIASVALVLGWFASMLHRFDSLGAEDRVIQAEIKLTKAQIAQARAELELLRRHVAHRDLKPDNRIEILTRRTVALRGALLALVRTGKVSMPGDPGGDWVVWPLELAEVPR